MIPQNITPQKGVKHNFRNFYFLRRFITRPSKTVRYTPSVSYSFLSLPPGKTFFRPLEQWTLFFQKGKTLCIHINNVKKSFIPVSCVNPFFSILSLQFITHSSVGHAGKNAIFLDLFYFRRGYCKSFPSLFIEFERLCLGHSTCIWQIDCVPNGKKIIKVIRKLSGDKVVYFIPSEGEKLLVFSQSKNHLHS